MATCTECGLGYAGVEVVLTALFACFIFLSFRFSFLASLASMLQDRYAETQIEHKYIHVRTQIHALSNVFHAGRQAVGLLPQ